MNADSRPTNTVACRVCNDTGIIRGSIPALDRWCVCRKVETRMECTRLPDAPYRDGLFRLHANGQESQLLRAELVRLHAAISAALGLAPEPAECKDCDKLMTERDEAEEMCDKLADAIAGLAGCKIGEHSSGNCPWQNALYAAEEMGPINPAQMLNIVEHASQLEVDYTAEDDMEIIEGFDRLRELLRPWRAERLPETKCETCDGRGEIGGFVHSEDAYRTDPCPDCNTPTKAGCSVPPAGWRCTREAGHDGPCAAVPV